MTIIFPAIATAFLVTFFCIFLLKPLASKLKLVAVQGAHRQHNGEIPLIGGLCVFIGFCIAALVLPFGLYPYRSLFVALSLLVFVGVLDDMHELQPKARFVSQFIAGLLMTVWGGVKLTSLGNLLFVGDITLNILSIPFTAFAVVGIINAMNMLDGADGLSGTLGIVLIAELAWLALSVGQLQAFTVLVLLIAAFIAFLLFNFPLLRAARIFLGDAGSMMLGFILVWFTVALTQAPIKAAAPVTMLWVMAVPLFDTGAVMISRLLEKQSPFHADRRHLHHLLAAWQLPKVAVVLIMALFTLLLGLVGLVGDQLNWPESWRFVGFLLLFLFYFTSYRFSWRQLNERTAAG